MGDCVGTLNRKKSWSGNKFQSWTNVSATPPHSIEQCHCSVGYTVLQSAFLEEFKLRPMDFSWPKSQHLCVVVSANFDTHS